MASLVFRIVIDCPVVSCIAFLGSSLQLLLFDQPPERMSSQFCFCICVGFWICEQSAQKTEQESIIELWSLCVFVKQTIVIRFLYSNVVQNFRQTVCHFLPVASYQFVQMSNAQRDAHICSIIIMVHDKLVAVAVYTASLVTWTTMFGSQKLVLRRAKVATPRGPLVQSTVQGFGITLH